MVEVSSTSLQYIIKNKKLKPQEEFGSWVVTKHNYYFYNLSSF